MAHGTTFQPPSRVTERTKHVENHGPDLWPGRWIWLYPATYAVHIAEEYWGGPGFARFVSHHFGMPMNEAAFLLANAVFWIAMCGTVAMGAAQPERSAWIVALATIVLINGTGHLAGSLRAGAYFPGLVSGLLLWVPLGALTIRSARTRIASRSIRSGILIGTTAHVLVPLVAASIAVALD